MIKLATATEIQKQMNGGLYEQVQQEQEEKNESNVRVFIWKQSCRTLFCVTGNMLISTWNLPVFLATDCATLRTASFYYFSSMFLINSRLSTTLYDQRGKNKPFYFGLPKYLSTIHKTSEIIKESSHDQLARVFPSDRKVLVNYLGIGQSN